MHSQLLSSTALLTGALFAASPAAAGPTKLQARDQKPIWTVAHKILRVAGLDGALKDEANAIEVDLTAWRKGEGADESKWWMDHDGDGENYGDPADVLLKAVGEKGGDQLAFVVFDIKNPDYCAVDEEGCGMETLVNMGRDFVMSSGIGVVYGFTKPDDAGKDAWTYVVENLDDDAAVRITGKADPVLTAYADHGSDIPVEKKIMDYGNPYLHGDEGGPKFGECDSGGDSEDVCPNLVRAVEERDNGNLGAVMLWTVGSSDGDGDKTTQVLDAGVNGIVYGYAFEEYEDSDRNVEARGHAVDWVSGHEADAKIATQDQRPWTA